MDITKVSIIHHLALVLLVLWILASLGCRHPIVFFLSLLYLYAVNESYSLRLRRRLQYEERKYASQRRLLSDSESVRWLNHAIEKIWPICMEQIASQQLLMPIIPWFLEKFKPWTAKKAVVQHLYLGRSPPMVTEIRVLGESTDDDHLVLELGMSFLSANDMSAILEVQLRKRLGLGIRAKMHVTGMHVEGKVLVGVKFLRHWPFLGRVRVCFVEPPYFQMTVKPILPHGVDVTELPGIAGWLDNILAVAFEQTLVEPNMLVVDVEKFVSSPEGNWFNVDEKPPIAFVKLEIIEAADMNPSDMNGLADPYVKGHLGPYRFKTKVQKKTLAPKWLEEFRIPICSWEAPNILVLGVLDKDLTFDDMMGDCSVNISDLRGGKRHEKWLTLQNIKKGRMLLAITVLEDEIEKEKVTVHEGEEPSRTPGTTSPDSGSVTQDHHKADAPLEKRPKEADEFEPISIEGKEKTSIWVHHPGSEVPQTWEPKKGRTRRPEIQLRMEDADGLDSPRSSSGSHRSDASSFIDFADGSKARRRGLVSRGLHKIGSFLNKSPRNHSPRYQSPRRRGDMGDQEGSLSSLGDRDDNFKTLLSRKLENLEQVEQGKGSEIGVMEKGERPDSSNRSSVDELKPAFVKESINGNTKIGSDSSSIGDSKEPKSDEAKVLIEGR